MVMQSTLATHDLVLIGGGHAHVQVLRRFGMQPQAGVRLTLISRDLHTPYSGMLPGLVAGHYAFDDAHIDLGRLARFAHARLYHDEVVGLDLARRMVLCRVRPPVRYDVLSIDSGATPAMQVAGAAEHAVAVKPVSNFYARWQDLRARVAASSASLRIGVVGGGAGGVELLLAMRHRLLAERDAAAGGLSFHIVTAGADILLTHHRRVRARYRRILAAAGVTVHTEANVSRVAAGQVTTTDGRAIALDEIAWVTHAAAPAWPRASGLATDDAGFIAVDACLRSISHATVFAAGDIAAVAAHPRPKAGVFAVRQGPPLAANLRRALTARAPVPFRPQRRFLSLISSGDRYAVASRGAFTCAGAWVWRWKDAIDRRFMRRFTDLPALSMGVPATADLAPASMRCGGCGAKIGAEMLHGALATLPASARADIVIGLGEPDDAAVVRLPPATLAVHTVDAFRSFVDDPWLFGRITATHCLGDIFAMGATAQSALAIVTLPLAAPPLMQDDLAQMLQGAATVFAAAGTVIVGGHTSEGAELALGFAVNGYVAEAALLRKRGIATGDALILTKALGSGVLLAAAMQGRGRTRWLAQALTAMTVSNAAAAVILRAHGAHAMTDVTGFGLAGHLLEMLGPDGVAATVLLDRVPTFSGAAELAGQGIASTLAPQNRAAAAALAADAAAEAHPHFALCFDPQTAGGLLAAVPASQAAHCVDALRQAGYGDAVVIGTAGAEQTEPRLHLTA